MQDRFDERESPYHRAGKEEEDYMLELELYIIIGENIEEQIEKYIKRQVKRVFFSNGMKKVGLDFLGVPQKNQPGVWLWRRNTTELEFII